MMVIGEDGSIRFGEAGGQTGRILFAGDFCPIKGAEARLLSGQGEALFGTMLPELLDKDLSIVNLEVCLTRQETPIRKIGPNLKVDPAILAETGRAGFDVYGLANNHTRDFGDAPFVETMRAITAQGRQFVGGGMDLADSRRPLRVVVNGLRVSILAVTMHNICEATAERPGATPLEPGQVVLAITRERRENDLVVVVAHDGKEHLPFPSARIRANYRLFIEAGADAVIGHHPHLFQGCERHGRGFIAYSLGNFLFPPRQPETAPGFWYQGYAVRLRVGSAGLSGVDIIPYRFDVDGCLRRLEGGERSAFFVRLNRLNAILADAGQSDRYYDAAARIFAGYKVRVGDFLQKLADAPASEEMRRAADYCNHMLTTEEHWDAVESQTRTLAADTTLEIPADLGYFTQY